MRDLTEAEMQQFRIGHCPVCGQSDEGFSQGPSGGISQNMFCNRCGAGINMPMIQGFPMTGQLIREPDPSLWKGHVVMADGTPGVVISNDDDVMDLLAKLASGEGGRRTGLLKRLGYLRWRVTRKGRRALKEYQR